MHFICFSDTNIGICDLTLRQPPNSTLYQQFNWPGGMPNNNRHNKRYLSARKKTWKRWQSRPTHGNDFALPKSSRLGKTFKHFPIQNPNVTSSRKSYVSSPHRVDFYMFPALGTSQNASAKVLNSIPKASTRSDGLSQLRGWGVRELPGTAFELKFSLGVV